MVANGTYTAVLDRFEDTTAVLVLEQNGDDIMDYTLDTSALPPEGQHEDAIFELVIDENDVVDITYQPDETNARKQSAQNRFDRLSNRPPSEEPDD